MVYINKITGAISYTLPHDYNLGIWRIDSGAYNPSTGSGGSIGSTGSTGSTGSDSKPKTAFSMDTFGGVVSLLTGAVSSVANIFGWGKPTQGGANINLPAAGGYVSNDGSQNNSNLNNSSYNNPNQNGGNAAFSFNWQILILPVVGIVVLIFLITKK